MTPACIYFGFNESRSARNLNEEQTRSSSRLARPFTEGEVECRSRRVHHRGDRLLTGLDEMVSRPILVFPDPEDVSYMELCRRNVLGRSGEDWWDRVMSSRMPTLEDRVRQYKKLGYDVRAYEWRKIIETSWIFLTISDRQEDS